MNVSTKKLTLVLRASNIANMTSIDRMIPRRTAVTIGSASCGDRAFSTGQPVAAGAKRDIVEVEAASLE